MNKLLSLVVVLGLFSLQCSLNADEEVLAYCGKQPITTADVELQLGKKFKWTSDNRPAGEVVATVVELIAQQRRALATLRRQGTAATPQEIISYAIDNLQPPDNKLTDPNAAIAAISKARDVDQMRLLENLAFRLSWQRYLAKHVTEKNVQRHFSNQKSRFDGTKYTINLILVVRPEAGGNPRAVERLKEISQLDASNIFDAARAAEVDGLTTKQLELSGVSSLPPEIFDAVEDIDDGKWTQVVETPVVLALTQRLEKTPGEKKLDEVEDPVRAHMLIHLLNHLAQQSNEAMPLKWSNEKETTSP